MRRGLATLVVLLACAAIFGARFVKLSP